MVSVIVPVYNAEPTLARCVDSLLVQTYQDLEIILVDDGSTDDSYSICQAYTQKDSRVKTFHKENGGVSSARNLGMRQAQGEWMGFVDADDYVDIDYVKSYFCLGEDADLLVQGYKQIDVKDGSTSFQGQPEATIEGGSIIEYVLTIHESKQLGYVWCKLFKKEIIQKYGILFDVTVHQREDVLFCLHYIQHIERIYNVAANNQYVYFNERRKGKYKKHDEIGKLFKLYDSLSSINGALAHQYYISGIYSRQILDYYLFGNDTMIKKQYIHKYLDRLYVHRDYFPNKDYRKLYRIFLLLSNLCGYRFYSVALLKLFSHNPFFRDR